MTHNEDRPMTDTGLREALRTAAEEALANDPDWYDDPEFWRAFIDGDDGRVFEESDVAFLVAAKPSVVLAALQSTPLAEGRLDVERLVIALRRLDERIAAESPENAVELLAGEAETGRRDYAAALAAEYARLAPVDGERRVTG